MLGDAPLPGGGGDARRRSCSPRCARPDGRLLRTWRAGHAHLDAYLEDYAFLGDALVDLYEAGGPERFLREAQRLAGLLREDFAAEDGGFYSTARGHEPLLVRHREGHDGATPSANAVAARLLARLSYHLGDDGAARGSGGRAARVRARRSRAARAPSRPASRCWTCCSKGRRSWRSSGARRAATTSRAVPRGGAALPAQPDRRPSRSGGAGGPPRCRCWPARGWSSGRAALYVCRDFACRRPVTDPAEVAAVLEAALRRPRKRRPPLSRAPCPGPPRRTAPGVRAASRVRGPCAAGRHWPRLQPRRLRRLPRGRRDAGASRSAAPGPARRLQPRRHVHQLHRRRQRAPGRRVLAELGARRKRCAGGRWWWSRRSATCRAKTCGMAREREAAGRPFPEMVKYAEGVWHDIHPEFLRDQLARLARAPRASRRSTCACCTTRSTTSPTRTSAATARSKSAARSSTGGWAQPSRPGVRGGRRPHPLVRRVVEHVHAARGRPRGHVAGADAGGRARGGRRRPPLPRAPAPLEPVRGGRGPRDGTTAARPCSNTRCARGSASWRTARSTRWWTKAWCGWHRWRCPAPEVELEEQLARVARAGGRVPARDRRAPARG